jgi:hypothetical protein
MLTRKRLRQLLDQGWTIKGASMIDEAEYWVLLCDDEGDTVKFPTDQAAWLLAIEVMGQV